jgi:hypothetical protein
MTIREILVKNNMSMEISKKEILNYFKNSILENADNQSYANAVFVTGRRDNDFEMEINDNGLLDIHFVITTENGLGLGAVWDINLDKHSPKFKIDEKYCVREIG